MSNDKTEQAHASWIEGKDRRLDVMSARPLVLSTPVALMAESRITSIANLYIRNIQDLADGMTIEPLPVEDWEVELTGLIEPGSITITGAELLEMEQVEYEMILQCSGNGRNQYNGIPGTPWNQGGVGNVVFSGVAIADILKKHGVRVDSAVKFVTAEGQDQPLGSEKPDFEHSLRVADVLGRSFLALKLNGEPLPGIHGGPVRLMTPGIFGTMHVKWLSRLRFEASESTNFYHATEYRVPHKRLTPGEKFKFTLENSRPTWDIRLMSYVLAPAEGANLSSGANQISGVAYNDGSTSIETVLVSVDKGQTWRAAELERPDSPYAWYRWSVRVDLQPGTHEIWSRAIDALGQSQPLDGSVYWNPNGYEWTGVFKVEVTVS